MSVSTRTGKEEKTKLLEAKKRYYRLFDEFGTHWMPYVQMGSRYGLETIIEQSKLDALQQQGIGVEVSAKVAWMKSADDCDESACEKAKHATKVRHMTAEVAGKKCAEGTTCDHTGNNIKPPGADTERNLEEKLRVGAILDDLERVVPLAKTIVQEGSGSWPRRSQSQFNGWSTALEVNRGARGLQLERSSARARHG